MTNSRDKGKRGELELVHVLKEKGIDAHRTQQFCGKAGDSDVVAEDLKLYHFEVKRVEKLVIDDAIEQAKRDCPEGKTPVVAHRRNRGEWLVTMTLEDWIDLAWKEDAPCGLPQV